MKKRWLLFLFTPLLLLVFLARPARADVNDFTITSFSGDYTLTNEDPQGKLNIKEVIDVEFTDNNHGILRAIPKKYKNNSLEISDIKVTKAAGGSWPFTTYTQNDNLVLRIGDPERTVTGAQTFIVEYSVRNVVTFYEGHDELYWDINGDQWGQPFLNVSATFNLPAPAKQHKCYTGSFGSTNSDCGINGDGAKVIAFTKRTLAQGETLTAVMSFDKGYFTSATLKDWLKEHLALLLGTLIPPLVIGWLAYRHWHKHGKDLKGRGVIVPEYGPPKGLSPAEVGTIVDYTADNRDISATIIDLAIRGYLKIIETEKKHLLKTSRSYSFELLKTDFSGLKTHEKQILEGIFPTGAKGEVVELKTLKDEFYKTANEVQTELSDSLTTNGFFSSNPRSAGNSMLGVAAALFFVALIFRSFVSIGLVLSAIFVAMLGLLMKKRAPAGVAAKEQIEGLKLYLNTAEKDRIKMLQSPGAKYAPKSTGPKRTVELFEKLLPFAIVLGVEKGWSEQFKDIYTTPPDWYSGNWHTFNSYYFVSSLTNSVGAMGTNFAAPSSSSSSGFGGGGFSGGGGGGGGGGGW